MSTPTTWSVVALPSVYSVTREEEEDLGRGERGKEGEGWVTKSNHFKHPDAFHPGPVFLFLHINPPVTLKGRNAT